MNDPAKPGPKHPHMPKAAPMPLSPCELSWLYLEQKRRETKPKAAPKQTLADRLRAAMKK